MRPFARKSHEEFTLVVVEDAPRLPPCDNARLIDEWIGSKVISALMTTESEARGAVIRLTQVLASST